MQSKELHDLIKNIKYDTFDYIILLIICLVLIIKTYFFDDVKTKGSRILLGDDNYPNLFLFLPDKKSGDIGIGIFDKDWHDYVGNTTREQLKEQLKDPKMYNFDKMSEADFVKEFGKMLKNYGKDPVTVYRQYRSFVFNQLYREDLDISKSEFEKNYSDDFKELGIDPNDVYDLLASRKYNKISDDDFMKELLKLKN